MPNSLEFLTAKAVPFRPLFIVYGDDLTLRRLVIGKIRKSILGEGEDDSSIVFQAATASLADVLDAWHTAPLFGERTLVIVEEADSFVSAHRAKLEQLVQSPPEHGCLVLEVKTWTSTTRLARTVPPEAVVQCKTPSNREMPGWCVAWAKQHHGKHLSRTAAQLICDLIEANVGRAIQELEKLATFVGPRPRITEQDVEKLVGGERLQSIWKICDYAAEGNTSAAIGTLVGLLHKGEEPLRIVAALAVQLRRLAQAMRLIEQDYPADEALKRAGTPGFAIAAAKQQLRFMGTKRAGAIYDRLIALQMKLRGGSDVSPAILLERFVLELCRGKHGPR